MDQGEGTEERLDVIWMKLCGKMGWISLPLRGEEVTVMTKKGESELGGLNDFLIDVMNKHFF